MVTIITKTVTLTIMSGYLNKQIIQMNVFCEVCAHFLSYLLTTISFSKKHLNLFRTLSACRFVSFFCKETQRQSRTPTLTFLK